MIDLGLEVEQSRDAMVSWTKHTPKCTAAAHALRHIQTLQPFCHVGDCNLLGVNQCLLQGMFF